MTQALNPSQKSWVATLALLSISESISNLLIAFYLWSKTQDLSLILSYHFTLFAAIPIAGIASSLLASKTSPKLSFALGLFCKSATLIAVAASSSLITTRLSLFGILMGVSVGSFAIPANTLSGIIGGDEIEKLNATNSFYSSLVHLVLPPFVALLLHLKTPYPILIAIASFVLIISLIPLRFIKLPKNSDTSFNLLAVVNPHSFNREKMILFATLFLDGIRDGLFWSVGSIVALVLIGSVGGWGIYSFSFTLLAILLSYTVARRVSPLANRPIVIFSNFAYSLACLFLGLYFNFNMFILYSLILTVTQSIAYPAYAGSLSRIIRLDRNYHLLREEYYASTEIPLALGRLTPVLLLLLANVTEIHTLVLRFIFAAIGLIPISTLSLLDLSSVWKIPHSPRASTSSHTQDNI